MRIYEHKSTTELLNALSLTITKLNKKQYRVHNAKCKILIKELKTRELTSLQNQKFNRLVTRYSWI